MPLASEHTKHKVVSLWVPLAGFEPAITRFRKAGPYPLDYRGVDYTWRKIEVSIPSPGGPHRFQNGLSSQPIYLP